MENELILQQIQMTQGSINFEGYEALKAEALDLAEIVSNIVVTDENIKESKKLMAAITKKVKEVDARRISIKKKMMEPYQDFEEKVKEILLIVNNSEDIVRNQIRELEEKERIEKRNFLEDLFNRRLSSYPFKDLFSFMDFLKPSHLNKTVTVDAVEKEMVEFLEKITKDLDVIELMPEKERLISFYLDEKDLGQAIALVAKEKERNEQIQRLQTMDESKAPCTFFIKIFDEKDYKMIKMFMEQNDIRFE